jgi:hypothetical protein
MTPPTVQEDTMSFHRNDLSPDAVAALQVDDTVVWNDGDSWANRLITAKVVRLTPTQVIVKRGEREVRFRKDGRMIGDRWTNLLDPNHPATRAIALESQRQAKRARISQKANAWLRNTRGPDGDNVLQDLRAAINDYLGD